MATAKKRKEKKREHHEAFDVGAARRELGLSAEGTARLLRLGEFGIRSVMRWQEVGHCPGPVAAFLDLLVKHPRARALAGVDKLAEDHPVGRDWR